MEIFRQPLRIDGFENSLLALILPHMPEPLRKALMSIVKLTFPHTVKWCDSQSKGEEHTFEAIHFAWYNRYSAKVVTMSTFLNTFSINTFYFQGNEAPEGLYDDADGEPAFIFQEEGKKLNTFQTMPRTSSELQEYIEEYEMVCNAFEGVFEWFQEEVFNAFSFVSQILITARLILSCTVGESFTSRSQSHFSICSGSAC